MPLESRDAAYVWDIVETSRSVREFTAGVKAHDYLIDRKLQLAVERAIEIIGEAARRVSDSFKTDHPEVPWRQISVKPMDRTGPALGLPARAL